uniref:Uncharacterized protein n=1 Tax=Anguilla anguilla TaxID=7936 RepID=A0A0E9UF65_ANGAN
MYFSAGPSSLHLAKDLGEKSVSYHTQL